VSIAIFCLYHESTVSAGQIRIDALCEKKLRNKSKKNQKLEIFLILKWFLVAVLVRRIVLPIIFLFDRLVVLTTSLENSNSAAIVIIRTDNLGDLILWLPAAKALADSKMLSGERVILVANSNWATLPILREIFAEVIPIDLKKFRQNIFYRSRNIRKLARLRSKMVINPIVSRESVTSDSLARAIKSQIKIAAAPKNEPLPRTLGAVNRWYTRLIWVDGTHHELLNNQYFAENLTGTLLEAPWPHLESAQQAVRSISGKYAVISPGGGSLDLKAWGSEKFARIADWLVDEYGFDIVVAGTYSERNVVDKFKNNFHHPVLDRCGTMSLTELIELIGDASLVVTNDTGMVHIAAALRVPTVVIVGGGDFGKFLPYPAAAADSGIKLDVVYHKLDCYQCAWRCIYDPDVNGKPPCIRDIAIDDVKQVIFQFLEKS